MDPSLPPPPPSTISTAAATTNHQGISRGGGGGGGGGGAGSAYADSISSPRSRNTDSWDNEQQQLPNSKLRLMCSYGGHIIPRPHDKSLSYIGGDTRIVAVDRRSSLASLSSKISTTLLNGRSFTLKYQLPNGDLDSLISVSNDEDLENMIEEHDRASASSRIRLFLFFSKPETAADSMSSLIYDSKSESWFVGALNGSGDLSGDSVSVNCLLGLDDVVEMDNQNEISLGNLNKQVKGGNNIQDVQSVIPDPPLMETNSSFGSTTSSPSMSNLPPIRVHVEDQKIVGLEDQFSHMNIAPPPPEGFALLLSPPPLPTTISVSAGAPQPQLQQKTSGGADLPSPEGSGRDNGIPNLMARPKQVYYQKQVAHQVPPSDGRNPVDPKRDVSDLNYRIQMQQRQQESGYALPPQQLDQQQQQFIPATGTHYIQQHGAGQVPIALPYYPPMYVPQQQQQHVHQTDQQIPMYYVPVHQTQSYNMSMQPNMSETSKISSNRPPTPPTPTMISTSVAPQNPGYPPRSAPPKQTEMASTVYRTTAPGQVGGQQMMHTATDQHQQQNFVSYHPMHHPSQSIQAPNTGNYAYEYSDPNHAQMYYAQPLPSHYQTMSVAQAVAAVSDAAASQKPTDQNTNKQ